MRKEIFNIFKIFNFLYAFRGWERETKKITRFRGMLLGTQSIGFYLGCPGVPRDGNWKIKKNLHV